MGDSLAANGFSAHSSRQVSLSKNQAVTHEDVRRTRSVIYLTPTSRHSAASCAPSIANGTASAFLLKLVSTIVEALSQQSDGLIRKVFVNEFPFIIAPTTPRCVVAT